ncbi:MAG: SAVED domain-containing protein [Rhizobium sp.]|nr:SAVED domain-containing protein [Rhizobium sp.]MDM8015811.1 SAVED domain-containing protein [Rhizobium sp.]
MAKPPHVDWLQYIGQFQIAGGADVNVWDFNHANIPGTLSAWANHFRNHYCSDADLLSSIEGTGQTKAEFLTAIKFPSATTPPGPSTRSGDFAEILAADFVEYQMGYWCPRLRYLDRWNPNDSTKGCDLVAFLVHDDGATQQDDELYVVECKAGLTGPPVNRLQEAINHSMKDRMREATTLNAMKQRLRASGRKLEALRVQRFQNEADHPFIRKNGAVAVLHNGAYDQAATQLSDTSAHPNAANLDLIVIKGDGLMALAHALYERAANEA